MAVSSRIRKTSHLQEQACLENNARKKADCMWAIWEEKSACPMDIDTDWFKTKKKIVAAPKQKRSQGQQTQQTMQKPEIKMEQELPLQDQIKRFHTLSALLGEYSMLSKQTAAFRERIKRLEERKFTLALLEASVQENHHLPMRLSAKRCCRPHQRQPQPQLTKLQNQLMTTSTKQRMWCLRRRKILRLTFCSSPEYKRTSRSFFHREMGKTVKKPVAGRTHQIDQQLPVCIRNVSAIYTGTKEINDSAV